MASKIITLDDYRVKPDGPVSLMCEVSVYDNGDVTVWLSDEIDSVEQFNWLFAKLAGATGSLFSQKVIKTESE